MISSRIKFQSLSNQGVIELKLSDHDPVLVDTPYGKVCYFNIMCQCAKTAHGFNNAFGIIESDEQYKARLQQIIKVLVELQKQHGVVGFMLQEAPQPGADHGFYQSLSKQLSGFNVDGNAFARKTTKTRACTFSTFDNKIFPQQNPGDFSSDGREQVIQLVANDGSPVTVWNFHGDFTAQDITARLTCDAIKKGAIVGGDLNILDTSQAYRDIVNACQGIAGARVCIESTRAFPQATIDIAICNHSPKMRAAHSAAHGALFQQAAAASSLPVIDSVEQRVNKDLSDYKFTTAEDAKLFSDLLFKKGVMGRDKKPLKPQSDGVTVIVHKDYYSIANSCCRASVSTYTHKSK